MNKASGGRDRSLGKTAVKGARFDLPAKRCVCSRTALAQDCRPQGNRLGRFMYEWHGPHDTPAGRSIGRIVDDANATTGCRVCSGRENVPRRSGALTPAARKVALREATLGEPQGDARGPR